MKFSSDETDIKPGKNTSVDHWLAVILPLLERSQVDTLGVARAIFDMVEGASRTHRVKVLDTRVRSGRDVERPHRVAVYALNEVEELRLGLKMSVPEFSKYRTIGRDDRLYRDDVKPNLPHEFTILYAITLLKDRNHLGVNEFECALKNGHISKDTKKKDIEALMRELRGEPEPEKKKESALHYFHHRPAREKSELIRWLAESSYREEFMAALAV